jgi:hypothetical protein
MAGVAAEIGGEQLAGDVEDGARLDGEGERLRRGGDGIERI